MSKHYDENAEDVISKLQDHILKLHAKISLLENALENEKKDRERIPVPRTVLIQILNLEKNIQDLSQENAFLKKYVPEEVIINIKSKNFAVPKRKGSGLR